jgi:hypothetical protein
MRFSLTERSPTAPFEMILRRMNDKERDESSARLRDRERRWHCRFFGPVVPLKMAASEQVCVGRVTPLVG